MLGAEDRLGLDCLSSISRSNTSFLWASVRVRVDAEFILLAPVLALGFKQAALRAGQLQCKLDGSAAHMVLHVGTIAPDNMVLLIHDQAC